MLNNKKILVLIVSYNAESTIERLLSRFPRDVLSVTDQIILADDASHDRTVTIAQKYRRKNTLKNLTIIKHQKNKGYGGNQKWGYNVAIAEHFDVVVMVHGDAQYPPEYIRPLIDPILNEKADFVFGSRMAGHPLKGGMPLYKFFGNIFLTAIENIFLNTRLSEFHSGFRAYSVPALKQIPFNLNTDNFYFDSQIIFQLVSAKKRIAEITIPTTYGTEKCNVRVIHYGLNILKELVKLSLHRLGLKHYEHYTV